VNCREMKTFSVPYAKFSYGNVSNHENHFAIAVNCPKLKRKLTQMNPECHHYQVYRLQALLAVFKRSVRPIVSGISKSVLLMVVVCF
jgi:hypothetical protein